MGFTIGSTYLMSMFVTFIPTDSCDFSLLSKLAIATWHSIKKHRFQYLLLEVVKGYLGKGSAHSDRASRLAERDRISDIIKRNK